MKPALLLLDDGRVFRGRRVGAEGEAIGEVVFNTALTGYQEIFTDPSYAGQIVTMTYPHIGNYGVNDEDVESRRPFLEGIVVKECCTRPSNWRSSLRLPDYLNDCGIVGIEGVDTRALTRHIRDRGARMGMIADGGADVDDLRARLRKAPGMAGRDMAAGVTTDKAYLWSEQEAAFPAVTGGNSGEKTFEVAVLDFGVKYNILRHLQARGLEPHVFPASTPVDDILRMKPDGVFLSNGPGDPEPLKAAADTVHALVGKLPMFGICLGHQIMGLALGGKTFKLKFGHHGANHPVKNLETGQIEITSQNHGFAVDPDSLPHSSVRITHVNLNDQTLEGFEHRELPAFAVQYHPEAAPGPHDSQYLFDRFRRLIEDSTV